MDMEQRDEFRFWNGGAHEFLSWAFTHISQIENRNITGDFDKYMADTFPDLIERYGIWKQLEAARNGK